MDTDLCITRDRWNWVSLNLWAHVPRLMERFSLRQLQNCPNCAILLILCENERNSPRDIERFDEFLGFTFKELF